MEKPIIIGAALLALFVVSSFAPFAAAQYAGVGGGGGTLEEQLKLARARIAAVQSNPHAGSGTPFLDANGVIGASIISGAVFGGIFIAFVVRAKQVEKARGTR
jgi:hypothetical protein